jgi:hypothetical protein
MDPRSLRQSILETLKKGWRPFMVIATAGTTVFGAFDNIDAIATVTQELGMWLHIDGSWGGSVLMSEKHRNLMSGCHHAESVVINPHKAMCVPLLCSVLILRDVKRLQMNRVNAKYLYHMESSDGTDMTKNEPDRFLDMPHQEDGRGQAHEAKERGNAPRNFEASWIQQTNFDLGQGALGCGRRPDILKLYLTWCIYGRQGIASHIDRVMALTKWFAATLRDPKSAGLPIKGVFELIIEPQFLNVCFYFYPMRLENAELLTKEDYQAKTAEHLNYMRLMRLKNFRQWYKEATQVTEWMHGRLQAQGQFMVDYAPMLRAGTVDWPNGWRAVIQHRHISEKILLSLLQELDCLGQAFLTQSL